METKNFFIEGMTCQSCEELLTDKISKLNGVDKINIDFASKKAKVIFDNDKVKFSDIKK